MISCTCDSTKKELCFSFFFPSGDCRLYLLMPCGGGPFSARSSSLLPRRSLQTASRDLIEIDDRQTRLRQAQQHRRLLRSGCLSTTAAPRCEPNPWQPYLTAAAATANGMMMLLTKVQLRESRRLNRHQRELIGLLLLVLLVLQLRQVNISMRPGAEARMSRRQLVLPLRRHIRRGELIRAGRRLVVAVQSHAQIRVADRRMGARRTRPRPHIRADVAPLMAAAAAVMRARPAATRRQLHVRRNDEHVGEAIVLEKGARHVAAEAHV